MATLNGAQLLVKCLEAEGVEYIFGIPGAKIDAVFDALLDSKIKLIVCRHEQNAAFIAAAYGRITGKPGVVLVTSGPGVTNLSTGLLTATTEGDPIIAIGGNVPRSMCLKQSHQSANNVKLMDPVTKRSVEVHWANNIPEVVENAFRAALTPPNGACFISIPQDVLSETSTVKPITNVPTPSFGRASSSLLDKAAELINHAKMPLILLGMNASRPENTEAIHKLLKENPLAIVSTFQAAGVVSKEFLNCFAGRVGLFKNQPADEIIDLSDLILTIGFNPVEYDPEIWNVKNNKTIIHLDYTACDVHMTYQPCCELLGDMVQNILAITKRLVKRPQMTMNEKVKTAQNALLKKIEHGKTLDQSPIHPLRFIYELRQAIDDKQSTFVCCDIGTVYMWMARYFFSFNPHQLLFSNGQQTLGVALPWAIACNYAKPKAKVISISGDGGFLFSAMELETAVREKLHFVHFIWRDGSYNMVLEQEVMKYKRKSGVDFGRVHIPDFAKSFGAIGLELQSPKDFKAVFIQALKANKPVLVDVPIDYSDNMELFKSIDPHAGH